MFLAATTTRRLLTVVITLVLAAAAYAEPQKKEGTVPESISVNKVRLVELSKWSLKSSNLGVRLSVIGHIQRYKLTDMAEALFKVLMTDKEEEVRVAAAIALKEICGEKGQECLEKSAETNNSSMVRNLCAYILAQDE